MMTGHGGGNMVGQTANQGQFLAQTQFPAGTAAVAATGAMNVTVGPGMGQPQAQAAVTQVRGVKSCSILSWTTDWLYSVMLSLFEMLQSCANSN